MSGKNRVININPDQEVFLQDILTVMLYEQKLSVEDAILAVEILKKLRGRADKHLGRAENASETK